MRESFRARLGASGSLLCAASALLATLAACGPPDDPGFDKVPNREQREISAHAAPDPPPVVAGIGETAGGARIVAANLPAGVTQAMVDEGQDLYGTVCVACHAAGGAGGPVAPALNDNRWINISGAFPEIVAVINTGVPNPKEHPGPMPPKGGGSFTDEQVRALAAYVYALSRQGGA